MITINNTENLTGVTISGDFNDLYYLVEAFHDITYDEFSEKHQSYREISMRVLGLCFDVRHAYQGDREIELVDNNLDEDKMKYHSLIASKSNVNYKCNYLYPEMLFIMLALNELVELRMQELTKSKYNRERAFDRKVIWDDTIAIIRLFQAEFVKCVKAVLTPASFTRWLKVMNGEYIGIRSIASQYVDLLNIKYLSMSKEKRLKSFNSIAKRIAEYDYDDEHNEIKKVVTEAAKEYGCATGAIRLQGVEYPRDIIW